MHTIQAIRDFIWSPPLIIFVVLVALYLTCRLRGLQFRYLGTALKSIVKRRDSKEAGDISHFQALMTALAATVGIGNMGGVATALMVGGVGALFWMIVIALLSMATSYTECFLAIRFREIDTRGEVEGGPMVYLGHALGWRWLGVIFAIAAIIATFASGNIVQVNAIADICGEWILVSRWWFGIGVAFLSGLVLIGGIHSIGRVAGYLVPIMALLYLGGGIAVLAVFYKSIPSALLLIFKSAFTGQAAVGGFLGSTFRQAVQYGVSRGLSSSEAGMGTSAIAAAAAKTDFPGRQALISMTGVFLSVCVICTLTALTLTVSGVLGDKNASGTLLNGVPLVAHAFQKAFPFGNFVVMIGAFLFGFSTIIGWAYYGERAIEYLLHERAIWFFRVVYILVLIPGAILDIDVVWAFNDLATALMLIPNLIGLLMLSNLVVRETKPFLALVRSGQ